MKQTVHEGRPSSISEIKELIVDLVASVSEKMLQRVTGQFRSRVGKFIEVKGILFQ